MYPIICSLRRGGCAYRSWQVLEYVLSAAVEAGWGWLRVTLVCSLVESSSAKLQQKRLWTIPPRWDLGMARSGLLSSLLGGRRMSPEPPAVLLLLHAFSIRRWKDLERETKSSIITRERGAFMPRLFHNSEEAASFLSPQAGQAASLAAPLSSSSLILFGELTHTPLSSLFCY